MVIQSVKILIMEKPGKGELLPLQAAPQDAC